MVSGIKKYFCGFFFVFLTKTQKNTLATVALTSIADLTGQKTQASLLLSLSNQHSFSRKRKNKKNNLNEIALSINFFSF